MELNKLIYDMQSMSAETYTGRIVGVGARTVEVEGLNRFLAVGTQCVLQGSRAEQAPLEVVTINEKTAQLLPFGSTRGISVGDKVSINSKADMLHPHPSWLGSIINCMGEPVSTLHTFKHGKEGYPVYHAPVSAHERKRVGKRLSLGVKALNTFLTCCRGQRMGIFAGSGVGKSVLMSQIARFSEADVIVIGLIGERGRELREFIDDYLGEDGRQKSVVVVATSDEPALARRRAAYTTLTVAEYFRDQGKHVLCLMDSVTRFGMAQREIGLASGEPPTSKGYTPSVFSELPRLLERAGPGREGCHGDITGLITVLVEGGDMEDPIADAVRGILDGHIVMDRSIAERGRFPAIDILRSVSRTMPGCQTADENALVQQARRYMSLYNDMQDMIRLGAYKQGSNPEVDEAIKYNGHLEAFLSQRIDECVHFEEGFDALAACLAAEKAKA